MLWAYAVFSSSQKAKDGPVADDELIEFARSVLGDLQQQSFKEDRELCGVIYRDGTPGLKRSQIYEGEVAACTFDWPENLGRVPRATFHTHGSYDLDYDSEVPSLEDINGDIAERIIGFVGTPGGRMWMVDWDSESAIQICGIGCLPKDPDFKPCHVDPPKERYSLEQLEQRARKQAGGVPC